MKTKIEWRNNVNFSVNTESGHQISLDGPIESGGNNNGARPTELLISGMGGCTAFDVICIAKQKGIKVTSFELDVDASRTNTKPSLIDKIHLVYKISADEKYKNDFEKIIQLSLKKQCSCCIIMGKAVEITHELAMI